MEETPPVPPPGPPAPDAIPADVRAPGGAWALAWVSVGCGVLVLLCGGGLAAFVASQLVEAERNVTAQSGQLKAEKESSDHAGVMLDALAGRVREEATSELPESLGDAPPPDPWGTPVRYRRITPVRASLLSAGPDRRFGTDDDVERVVRLE